MMATFSRRQQVVLGVGGLAYGLWLIGTYWSATQRPLIALPLARPDPPELQFYLDPPINLNTGTSEELQLLPAIGPVLAERLIHYRVEHGPFTSFAEVDKVYGIGPKTLQKLRYYVTFDE